MLMKCCCCGTEIDIRNYKPKWYGSYCNEKIKKIICQVCIQKPGNEEWYKDDPKD
jgi:hypothetical protein